MYDKKHCEWVIQDLATQYRILDKLIKDKENEIDIINALIEVDDSMGTLGGYEFKTRIEICILAKYHLEVLKLLDAGYSD